MVIESSVVRRSKGDSVGNFELGQGLLTPLTAHDNQRYCSSGCASLWGTNDVTLDSSTTMCRYCVKSAFISPSGYQGSTVILFGPSWRALAASRTRFGGMLLDIDYVTSTSIPVFVIPLPA
jgi:hypothetical protein